MPIASFGQTLWALTHLNYYALFSQNLLISRALIRAVRHKHCTDPVGPRGEAPQIMSHCPVGREMRTEGT